MVVFLTTPHHQQHRSLQNPPSSIYTPETEKLRPYISKHLERDLVQFDSSANLRIDTKNLANLVHNDTEMDTIMIEMQATDQELGVRNAKLQFSRLPVVRFNSVSQYQPQSKFSHALSQTVKNTQVMQRLNDQIFNMAGRSQFTGRAMSQVRARSKEPTRSHSRSQASTTIPIQVSRGQNLMARKFVIGASGGRWI
uniref:Uncharacterized protein n=1 Tax=Spironucleus salmonicida TaxID=348837 RepID=V6LU19_9EUKA|eukprot:EST48105.1 Hypothetical protein SS50377_11744 [Spironucleus salmonicida]